MDVKTETDQRESESSTAETIADTEREPLPTDSMVTVPLSDLHSPREPDSTHRLSVPLDSPVEKGSEPTAIDDNIIPKDNNHDIKEDSSTYAATRKSCSSSGSRKSSENALSGSGGNSTQMVDWEALERNEELEPKTNATDEVSFFFN